jgi:hypothetical protein
MPKTIHAIETDTLTAVVGGQHTLRLAPTNQQFTPTIPPSGPHTMYLTRQPIQPMSFGVRRPPQTPGVPRLAFEHCLMCGPLRWRREMSQR